MAVFRIHRKAWESGRRPAPRVAIAEEGEDEAPGAGRKGVSSGLSVIVTRKHGSGGKAGTHSKPAASAKARVGGTTKGTKAGWWKEMG